MKLPLYEFISVRHETLPGKSVRDGLLEDYGQNVTCIEL